MRLPPLRYYVDFDWDYYYPGCAGCDPQEDDGFDYCRCGEIEVNGIRDIYYESLAKEIAKINNKDTIFAYCAERILRLINLDCIDYWDVQIEGGYYGQEFGDSRLETGKESEVLAVLQELEACSTPSDMVRLALKWEYGFVLPKLEIIEWGLQKILLKDVIIPNPANYSKTPTLAKYSNYGERDTLPHIVLDGDMQLVDGYHRFKVLKEGKKLKCLALVPKEREQK